jgi:hypothetical protein
LFGIRDKAILLALMNTGVWAAEFVAIDLASGVVLIRWGKGRKPRSRKTLR